MPPTLLLALTVATIGATACVLPVGAQMHQHDAAAMQDIDTLMQQCVACHPAWRLH